MNVIALGFFDGVHIGHAALLEHAAALPGKSAALTFDVRPETLTKGIDAPLIMTPGDRKTLLLQYVSDVFTLNFGNIMRLGWRDFIKDVLAARFDHVVAGEDFRFGYRGEGDAARLSAECAALGIGCGIIPEVTLDGTAVSSTHIRALISNGDAETAARFLGRPHFLSGTVEHGRGLGKTIGSPTVNLPLSDGLQIPAMGVYLTNTVVNGEKLPSVTNIGVRPTVESDAPARAETTIFDFDGCLYGERVRVELLKFMRPERKFADISSLKAQIQTDMEKARRYHQCQLKQK